MANHIDEVPLKFIIVMGNPVDGFEHIGPFDSADEANEYAENGCNGSLRHADWWVVLLQEPAHE